MLNLINHQLDIDKNYLYAKDSYEAKYQFLINKREGAGIKHFNDSEAFIEYSNNMMIFIKICKKVIQIKKRKILIIFDGMSADMLNNKKLNPIVTDIFIRGRKIKISVVITTQSYFVVLKNIRLNLTHHFIMENPNKQELNKSHLIIHQILT